MNVPVESNPPSLGPKSADTLEANLAALGPVNHVALAAIRAAEDRGIEIETAEDGRLTGTWNGRRLASARRPAAETSRLVEEVDLSEHACIAIIGFGLGDHVEAFVRRLCGTGVVVVLETDAALLRAVFSRLDLSDWLADERLILRVDPDDSVGLAASLAGAHSLMMIGTRIVEHPPSRGRIGAATGRFSRSLVDLATTARTSMTTMLAQSGTTIENQLSNLDHYAMGAGIEDLAGIARGRLGVVVSAGPSLRRNLEVLARPGVRDRCAIVATQTTLRPLLDAGIAPHFVTALDYHVISSRFYEGLDPAALEDTELVIDSRVNRAVTEAWPGRIRCIPSTQLDEFLGPLARGGSRLQASTTVAHLAYTFARHLGCDPVALIGQDLGFTDGLYYAPGTAIHEVWLPELNSFNTVETMEWERIVRHRNHLSERHDVNGRRIFTDAQMLNYLQSFEVRFAEDVRQGLRIVDATEGGVRKRNTEVRTLLETIEAHAGAATSAIDFPRATVPEAGDRRAVLDRLALVRSELDEIAEASERTLEILERMLQCQSDRPEMDRLFQRLEAPRATVRRHSDSRRLTDWFNQIATFQRLRADRRIRLAGDLEPIDRQRAELERDIVNVRWARDASRMLGDLLQSAGRLVTDGVFESRLGDSARLTDAMGVDVLPTVEPKVVAVVPIDPHRGGLGVDRGLAANLAGRSILQRTLERIDAASGIAAIALLVPEGFDVESAVDRTRLEHPIHVHACGSRVFGPEHEAIRIARAVAPTSWRGGIHGMTSFDEVFAPGPTAEVLAKLDADAALLVGADWPFVAVDEAGGLDEILDRHRKRPDATWVFGQGPPGRTAMVLNRTAVEIMRRNRCRVGTIGYQLAYRPEMPEGDPIVGESCVHAEPAVRSAIARFAVDTPREIRRIERAIGPMLLGDARPDSREIAIRLEHRALSGPLATPRFLRVELNTGRTGRRIGTPDAMEVERAPMEESMFRRVVEPLADAGDTVLFLDGAGDPVLHPRFDDFIEIAMDAGVRVVSIRTDLAGDPDVVDRLLATRVGVVEVDLDAETAETYRLMHGSNRFEEVIGNLERLIAGRRRLDGGTPAELPMELAFALPWVVPRFERRTENIDELPEFFERWRRRLGVAVIDGPVRWPATTGTTADPLSPTWPPPRHDEMVNSVRMTVLADGSVPTAEMDLVGHTSVGRVGERTLQELWQELVQHRRDRFEGRREEPGDLSPLRP